MSKKTQSKLEYKKSWRKRNYEEKRFNKVLSKYLKLKHGNIYEECCGFFKILNEKNPSVRDLTKTAMFKRWEAKQQQHDSDDDEAIMLYTYHLRPGSETVTKATIDQISQKDILDQHDVEANNGEQQHGHDHVDEGNNSEQQHGHDHVDEGNNSEQQHGHDHVEGNNGEQQHGHNIIQQIIDELELNQDLNNILNDEPQHDLADDEGIGLSSDILVVWWHSNKRPPPK